MRQHRVYDLPTRVFHWVFAFLFMTAFIITKTVDDESPTFTYHMLMGMMLGFSVLLRLIWGFTGTMHARFSGFALNPAELIGYLKGVFTGDKRKWAGHNPASSWSALAMMLLALALGFTGYLMTSGSANRDDYKEIHELFANAFIIIVVLHVAGVIFHTIRHKDIIGLSMLDGKKANVSPNEAISSSQPLWAIVFLVLLISFATYIKNNYDLNTQTLHIFGTTLQLGENENEEHEGVGEQGEYEEHEANESEQKLEGAQSENHDEEMSEERNGDSDKD